MLSAHLCMHACVASHSIIVAIVNTSMLKLKSLFTLNTSNKHTPSLSHACPLVIKQSLHYTDSSPLGLFVPPSKMVWCFNHVEEAMCWIIHCRVSLLVTTAGTCWSVATVSSTVTDEYPLSHPWSFCLLNTGLVLTSGWSGVNYFCTSSFHFSMVSRSLFFNCLFHTTINFLEFLNVFHMSPPTHPTWIYFDHVRWWTTILLAPMEVQAESTLPLWVVLQRNGCAVAIHGISSVLFGYYLWSCHYLVSISQVWYVAGAWETTYKVSPWL